LEEYTEEVQRQRYGNSDDPEFGLSNMIDISWSSADQWAKDMANWQKRLAHYRSILDDVPSADWDTVAGCKAIYTLVTAPLLDGIYYEHLPGITLSPTELERMKSGIGHPSEDVTTPGHVGGHSNAKPPDVATPYWLGNGILVFQEHQRENLEKLWEDIKENFRNILKKVGKLPKVAFPVVELLLGLAAIGGIGYGLYKLEQSKKPERYD
jgi:hypothetical protein